MQLLAIALGVVAVVGGAYLVANASDIDSRQRERDTQRPALLRMDPDLFPTRWRGAFLILGGLGIVGFGLLGLR